MSTRTRQEASAEFQGMRSCKWSLRFSQSTKSFISPEIQKKVNIRIIIVIVIVVVIIAIAIYNNNSSTHRACLIMHALLHASFLLIRLRKLRAGLGTKTICPLRFLAVRDEDTATVGLGSLGTYRPSRNSGWPL